MRIPLMTVGDQLMKLRINKTIDEIEPVTLSLKTQNSKNQMLNWVSFVESLSRPFLNKQIPENKKARCLGSWAYTGPGYDNEVVGKIEKDGIVTILNSSMDLIWHSIEMNGAEVWIPTSKLEFSTQRILYDEFDRSSLMQNIRIKVKYTTCTVGLRENPTFSSHCLIILKPKTKIKIIWRRNEWYQVIYQVIKVIKS